MEPTGLPIECKEKPVALPIHENFEVFENFEVLENLYLF
jgi:hypothetical protein|tara:strand:+ start:99 stop:215 length:117 start_codon:yes stop_codon:yes gene_type:complete